MENKEIYIDGVDVSEWTDEEIRYNFEKHSPKAIRQIAFDLYKQLKREGQECEELKSDLTDLSKIIDCKNGTILTFKEQLDQLKAKNIKIYKTLAEIKEIAEKAAKCLYVTKSDDYTDGYRWLGSIILQKISEYEVENERKENCN